MSKPKECPKQEDCYTTIVMHYPPEIAEARRMVIEQLEELKREYLRAAQPFVDELVRLENYGKPTIYVVPK